MKNWLDVEMVDRWSSSLRRYTEREVKKKHEINTMSMRVPAFFVINKRKQAQNRASDKQQLSTMDNRYLTRNELARHFKVSLRTVDAWVRRGCPRLKLNPTAKRPLSRFVVGEVESWLASAGKEVEA